MINYYTPNLVPVTNAMAENFVLFDRWFCSVPDPTEPNPAYLTSGTSHGHGDNGNVFYTSGMPQKSIFQQLSENVTWANYQNTTDIGSSSFLPDALFYDLVSEHAKSNIKYLSRFYSHGKAGQLPQFTWINPE